MVARQSFIDLNQSHSTTPVPGDHQQPTKKLAKELDMDDYFYDILPQEKANIVEQLQKRVKFIL